MKSLIIALSMAVASVAVVPSDVEAKRLGGGGSSGLQRSTPSRAAPDSVPAKQATSPTAAPAAGAAPAAAPKRSWMGPIAGLAAGLGIAALMSHLGLGAEFGNIIMMVLLAVAAVFLVRFLMRRFGPQPQHANAGGLQFAGAAAGPQSPQPPVFPDYRPGASGAAAGAASLTPQAEYQPPVAAVAGPNLPAGFDTESFERIAKMIFIRMQTANDAGDLNDLRAFTTPEMFAAAKLDLQERGDKTQRTDVVKIDAQVIDFDADGQRQLVSVRFHGLIREETDGVAQPFDEVWHLAKPDDGSREWAIAGIQQTA